MKKVFSKVLITLIVTIMGVGFLGGCGTSSVSVKNTPEDVIESFMKFRKSGKLDNLKELISDNYLASQGLDTEQYVSNLEDFDFKNSFEFIDYKISDLIDISEDVKKVNVIIKYSDNLVSNASTEEVYGIINEEGQWKVSPYGVINSYTCTYEDMSEEDGKLSVYVDKLINFIDGAMINIKVNNKSEYDFSLGWVEPAKVIVDTDKGQYVQSLPPLSKITRGMNDNISVEIQGLEGELEKVTITPVHVLNNGLPTPGDSGEEIVVFQ